jgi:CRP/FNR family transcriptional regulator, cAMP and macrophage regulator
VTLGPPRHVDYPPAALGGSPKPTTATSGGLGPAELQALAQRCPERTLRAGQCLFREGSPLPAVHVVRRGLVGLGRRIHGRRLTFLLLRPGDIAGDEAAVLGSAALADAFAVTDASVLDVPVAEFLHALDLRSPFVRRWAAGLGGRLSAFQTRLEQVLAGDLRSSIASLLLHELRGHARVVNFTQQTIADLLGVQRTSVSRTLHDLQRQGIVDVGYGHIAVRDIAGLAKAAGIQAPHRAIA